MAEIARQTTRKNVAVSDATLEITQVKSLVDALRERGADDLL